MLVLLTLHLAAALLAPALLRRLGPRGCYLLAAAPAAAFGWAVARTPAVRDGGAVVETYPWADELGLALALRMTTLSWLMVLLVTGVGALVLAYCARYFDARYTAGGDPGLGRFAGTFVGFAGAMLGLVVSDDLILLYVFWELTTVFSYLLIGYRTTSRTSRLAAIQALVVTTLGGLAMLVGIVLLGEHAGSYRWSEVAQRPPDGAYLAVALALILVGALSKSAIFPFSFWLPAAMAAPTPVSAYLHAAAMVKAGVFLVAQLAPVFADDAPWRPVVLLGGAVTMLLGGWAALRQDDLKLLLAYGTVSQLGLLTVVLGAGTRVAALAGATMLLAHALFKAALFLVVGVIDRATGTRDLRRLDGLGRRAPALAWIAVLATASMAGLPPLLGFVGKEAIFEAFLRGGAVDRAVLAAVVLGSALTVAYSLRFLWGAFAPKDPADREQTTADREQATAVREHGTTAVRGHGTTAVRAQPDAAVREAAPVPWDFLAAPAVLAVAGLVAGLAAPALDRLLSPYAGSFPPAGTGYHLALWHGPGPALGLSALVLALGAALFFGVNRPGRWRRVRLPGDGAAAYQRLVTWVDRLAVELTGATQRGSLPFYLGVILLVLVVFAGGALLTGRPFPEQLRLWDSPLHLLPAFVLVSAAVFAARARRRLTAVILVGVTGYANAGLFILYGAPDLALTQFLVETVTLVAFVLVLRRLPEHFSDRPRGIRRVRVAVGVAVGMIVAGMAYAAVGAREVAPVSVDFPDLAVSYGGGRNVVNVILVDIRAWDTMGEIAVLVAVITGVASLIFRRPGRLAARRPRPPSPPPAGDRQIWLMAGHTLEAGRRSVILEVITRLLFHTIVLLSVYLLFSGHNAPGGGFAGGMVAGLALVVRYLAGGRYELAAAAPVDAGQLVGIGLFVAVGTGAVAMLFGGDVLQSALLSVHLPVLGHVKFVTSTIFDVGVYLVVVGVVLEMLRSLGAEVDRHQQVERDEERAAADSRSEPKGELV